MLFNNSPFLPRKTKVNCGEFQLFLPKYNRNITYQLLVSRRRKSLSLELKRAQITVRTPHWLSHHEIESFIVNKQKWLIQKLSEQETLIDTTPMSSSQFHTGSHIMLRGEKITLQIESGTQYSQNLDLNHSKLTLTVPNRVKNHKNYIVKKLTEFYQEHAISYIGERFSQLQNSTGLKASSIEFKVYKRRWGCCYRSRLIRINPMIMGAPDWVIDCVLIHELCHLQHMDHSPNFWQLNHVHCGKCNDSKEWLKQNGHLLQLN